jgi:hypothetical protein
MKSSLISLSNGPRPGVVFAAALISFIILLLNLSQDISVRSGDSLYNYALSESLVNGEGYGTACVQHYHDKYPNKTWVVDAFRAPLGPLVYAGLTWIFRTNAFIACTLFNLILVCFLYPFLAYSLGREIFGQKAAGLWAALLLAVHPLFHEASLSCSQDLILAALLSFATLFFLQGWQKSNRLLLSGLMLGLAFLVKETALIFLVSFFMIGCVLALAKRITPPPGWWKYALAGTLICLAIGSIWPLRNASIPPTSALGKGALLGVSGFENRLLRQAHRIPMWWRPVSTVPWETLAKRSPQELVGNVALRFSLANVHLFLGLPVPGLSDPSFEPDFALPYFGITFPFLRQLEVLVKPGGLSSGLPAGPGRAEPMYREAVQLALSNMTATGVLDSLAGRTLFIFSLGAVGLMGFWRLRQHSAVLAVFMLIVLSTLGISLVTYAVIRYYLTHFLLVAVVAGGAVSTLGPHGRKLLAGAAVLSVVVASFFLYLDWHRPPRGSADELKLERRIGRMEISAWLKAHSQGNGMVVMTEAPIWEYAYSRVPAVAVPFSPRPERQLEMLLDVIQFYGVTHVVVPKQESLDSHLFAPLLGTEAQGWLQPAYTGKYMDIYYLDPAQVPAVEVTGKRFSYEDLLR